MKRLFVALMAVSALLFTFAAPAAAEGHEPTMTAEPASVAAAGEHDFVLTGEDFDEVGGFIIPCPGLTIERVTEEDFNVQTECDLATGLASGSYTVADRSVDHPMTLDIPEDGLVMVFGDQGGANAGAFYIAVGEAEAMEEAPAEEMEDAEEMEEMEEMEDTSALADTGVESSLLLVLGGAVVIAGGLFVNTRRQLNI